MKHKKDVDYADETTFIVAVETEDEYDELMDFLERNSSTLVQEKYEKEI